MPKVSPDEKQYSIQLKERVASSLKRLMFEHGITGVTLSKLTGFDPTYISQLRSGTKLPNFENFTILLESLPEESRNYFLQLLFGKPISNVAEKSNTY